MNPALTVAPRLLDSGAHGSTAPAAIYVGLRVTAVDANSPTNVPSDSVAPILGGFSAPAEPSGAADTGSHVVTISNITSAQAIITSNQAYNLTYASGPHAVDYTDLIAHFSASGTALPVAVSAEYVGGKGPGRSMCA
jgi:hypothetical protein